MPVRRGVSGALSGAGDFIDELIRQQMSNQDAQRNDVLERGRQFDALVEQGKADPADKAAYLRGQAPGPNVSERLGGVLAGLKDNPQQTSGTIANTMQAKRLPVLGFGEMPSGGYDQGIPNPNPQTGASVTDDQGQPLPSADAGAPPPLPSTNLGPTNSPEMTSAFLQRRAQLPLKKTGAGLSPDGTPFDVMGREDPDTGLLDQVQQLAQGGSAQQQGTAEGTKGATSTAIQAQPDADKAALIAKQTKQADLSVENAPGNVKASANRAATIAGATSAATETGKSQAQIDFAKTFAANGGNAQFGQQIAKQYLNTSAGRAYAYIPPETPTTDRQAALMAFSSTGVKPVNSQQAQSLQSIDAAITNYKNILDELDGYLAKSVGGRPLTAATNTFGAYSQSNPALAAYLGTKFPEQIAALKAVTGNIGRLMQVELTNTSGLLPGVNDTRAAAYNKLLQYGRMLAAQQDSILGKKGAQ